MFVELFEEGVADVVEEGTNGVAGTNVTEACSPRMLGRDGD